MEYGVGLGIVVMSGGGDEVAQGVNFLRRDVALESVQQRNGKAVVERRKSKLYGQPLTPFKVYVCVRVAVR